MTAAHGVNYAVAGILYLLCKRNISAPNALVHFEVKLGHHTVCAADTAVRAHAAPADKLFIRPVEHDKAFPARVLEHLDILNGHGRIFHRHDARVLAHLRKQRHGKRYARKLRNIVNDKISVGRRGRNRVPIRGDCMFRQMEIDGRDGGNGVHALLLCMACKLLAVTGIVAGYMSDHRKAPPCLCHYVFQNRLPLADALVDALARRAADINAFYALFGQMARQCAHPFGADLPCLIITGIEGRNNPLVFLHIIHLDNLLFSTPPDGCASLSFRKANSQTRLSKSSDGCTHSAFKKWLRSVNRQ